ncbi:type II toxin-antitoxin system VapC family toxin [Streptosporangium sp. NPDC048047]|uniref:type II toxin-antitoxin system VapC family toxin n=1 Tax=Streptosporangium sp. NPDC048047 TaxID=3155748 RepID=UPI003438EFBB
MSDPHNLLLDTSAVIDLERLDEQRIAGTLGCRPGDLRPAISCISMAELAAGPHAAKTADARAVRQAVPQWAESTFDPIPFDTDAARAYGIIYALVLDLGRRPRKRLADLLIASVAAANGLPLVTRNPDDFAGLESQIQVITA